MVRRRGCELSTCCGTTRSSLRLLAFQPEWRLCPLSQSLHPSTLWSLFLSCAHRPSTRLHTIPSHCRPASFHVTCGRAPPHRPMAGSELQWASRPRGTSTTTQHAPLLHNRNDGTRRLVLAAHRVRSMWVVQAAFYVRTRPTAPPAGRIRTAVGEPTPRNEHHHPARTPSPQPK